MTRSSGIFYYKNNILGANKFIIIQLRNQHRIKKSAMFLINIIQNILMIYVPYTCYIYTGKMQCCKLLF